ncbi:S24/S26 family peptidase [Leucobacter salsicius]|uniref:hypothetical protein n=1 Tax=Leucobacter salsicius TaxID=664638 RepID=UPI00034BEFA1|nr:hypothetical protein [Leucobacter salsicius]
MKIFLKAIGGLIYTAIMVMLVLGALLTALTQSHTVALFSTQSASMEPRYPTGGLTLAVTVDHETIREGDVFFAQQKGNERFVMHRVIAVSDTVAKGETVFLSEDGGDTYTRTVIEEDTPAAELTGGAGLLYGPTDIAVRMQGDANPTADGETYLIHSQIWKPVLQVKGAGYVFDLLTSPTTLLWGGGTLIIFMLVVLLIPTRKPESSAVTDRGTTLNHEPTAQEEGK